MSERITQRPTLYALRAWEHNLQIALMRWTRVNPDHVLPELDHWTCGSYACFGGHLGTWKEFRELGIFRDGQGAPSYRIRDQFVCDAINKADGTQGWSVGAYLGPARLSLLLFGNESMFLPRMADEFGSAHTIVRRRIERQLASVRDQLTKLKPPIARGSASLFMSPR